MSENETSLSKLRTLQFNDKMTTLNKDFLKSLRHWFEQCPHYDFSATVKSYLTHVQKLEEVYGLNKPAQDENKPVKQKTVEEATPEKGSRIIKKAKRRLADDPSKLNDSVAISTPAGAPPRFSLGGNISAIGPIDSPVAAHGEPNAAPGGRKRIIRGGGPSGGAESVHFRGNESLTIIPPMTLQLPKPTAGFWDKHKDTNHVGSMPVFNLVKPKEDVAPLGEAKEEPKASVISFGGFNKEKPAEIKEAENPPPQKDLLTVPKPLFTGFGGFSKPIDSDKPAADSSEAEKPKISFGGFGTTKTDDKPTLTFPMFGGLKKSDEEKPSEDPKPPLMFPKFGETQKSDDSKPPVLTFGTPAPSLFGKSAPLMFGNLQPAVEENKDEEEGEYVPPKAEVVENAEPGATYSVKCAVFKMVDKKFDKMGVGMLHLKEVDGKKSVLVRAATAIGTVWMNALINSSMKAAKAGDEKGEKLRITVPLSATEIGIFLVRFPNQASAEKVLQHIESNTQ